MQARPSSVVAAALINRGADVAKRAAALTQAALNRLDDILLAALVKVAKRSVLDTMDINFRTMNSANLPCTAAACAALEAGMLSNHLCIVSSAVTV